MMDQKKSISQTHKTPLLNYCILNCPLQTTKYNIIIIKVHFLEVKPYREVIEGTVYSSCTFI